MEAESGQTCFHEIFEPFFTTKAKDENPGLGLTVCLAIMQEHDGRIEVESTEEHGTCVTLFLPDKAKPAAICKQHLRDTGRQTNPGGRG